MAIDDPLSALLPDPPPPRPARREATIGQAMRRFDGHGQAPPRASGARAGPAHAGWGRPQIAALASVALVLLVSVPIWWTGRDRVDPRIPSPAEVQSGAPAPPTPPAPRPAQGPVQARPDTPDAPAAISAPRDVAPLTASEAPLAARASAASMQDAREQPSARQVAAPAPAAAARPLGRAEADTAIVVTGSRIERQDFDSATPVTVVNEALLDDGDWDTCTLRDTSHDAGACRAFADPAARGAAGRAATRLAEGLALAWQGDLDRAVTAFDRAIEADPDLAAAYLNRGLAYQEKGDLRRALADLNRAVEKDRRSARGYYHRSLLQRARGDTARAEADARRAIEIDPRYRAVLP
jgi:hypothetical protein